METAFQVSDRVRSNVDAQNLVRNREYVVVGVEVFRRAFSGAYVTYFVRDAADDSAPVLSVGNGHLVLSRA